MRPGQPFFGTTGSTAAGSGLADAVKPIARGLRPCRRPRRAADGGYRRCLGPLAGLRRDPARGRALRPRADPRAPAAEAEPRLGRPRMRAGARPARVHPRSRLHTIRAVPRPARPPPPRPRAGHRRLPARHAPTARRSSTAGRRRRPDAEGAARRARARARPTSATCCSRTSTSTTPGAAGVLVREHPGLTRARLGDRRAAPRRPAAGSRRARGGSTATHFDDALGRARARAGGERPRSSATACSASTCFPTPGHASHHVCYLDARRDALRGRRGRRAHPAGAHVLPVRAAARHRRRGLARDARRDRAARARSGSRSSTSASPTTSSRHLADLRAALEAWAEPRSRAASSRTTFVAEREAEIAAPPAGSAASTTRRRCRRGSRTPGIRRWADKRRERAA